VSALDSTRARRHQGETPRTQQRQHRHEAELVFVDAQLLKNRLGRHSADHPQAAVGECKCGSGAHDRHRQAFDHQLTEEPAAARPKRRSHRQLSSAPERPHQHEVRHIRRRNRDQQCDRQQEKRDDDPETRSSRDVPNRNQPHAPSSVGVGMLRRQRVADQRNLGRRTIE
jgi:hypothetical protein